MSYSIPKNLLDINSSNSLLLEDGSRTYPAISFDSQTDMGITRSANFQLGLVAGLNRGAVVGTSYIHIGVSSYYAWRTADQLGQGSANETRLRRDDKGILGITTYDDSPTGLNLYNTYTDASNYERLEIKWDTNVATIAATSAGTGTDRSLKLRLTELSDIEVRDRIIFTNNLDQIIVRVGGNNATIYNSTAVSQLFDFLPNVTANPKLGKSGYEWGQIWGVDGNFSGDITASSIINTSAIILDTGYIHYFRHSGNTSYLMSSTALYPNNSKDLGTTSKKWANLYCTDASFSGDLVTEAGGNQYIYNTYTDASNYERLEVKWDANVATIESAAAGTGTKRDILINGVTRFKSASSNHIEIDGGGLNNNAFMQSRGNGFYITAKDGYGNSAGGLQLAGDNGVSLKHGSGSGSALIKLKTTTSGIDVTGSVTSTDSTRTVSFEAAGSSGYPRAAFLMGDTSINNVALWVANSTTSQKDATLEALTNSNTSLSATKRVGLRATSTSGQIYVANQLGNSSDIPLRFYPNGISNDFTIQTEGTEVSLGQDSSPVDFYSYNTYTDASNYERLEIKWESNTAKLLTAYAGTGTARTFQLGATAGAFELFTGGGAPLRWRFGGDIRYTVDTNSFYPIGTRYIGKTTNRFANVYSVDSSFSGDLNIEDGGYFKFFGLGDSHTNTVNTQWLQLSSTTQSYSLSSKATGTGVSRDIYMAVGSSNNIMLRSDHTRFMKYLRPQTTNTTDIGHSSFRFRKSYLVDGSFSGDLVTEAGGNQYIYNTYTDASNYERLEIKWDANVATIEQAVAGTGVNRRLDIVNGSSSMRFYYNSTLLLASGFGSAIHLDNSQARLTAPSGGFVAVRTGDIRPYDAITPISSGQAAARWATTYTKGIATDVETFTATDTLDDKNQVCLCNATSGNITLNLPVASSTPSGTQYQIKKIDSSSNTVIITPNSGAGDLIDGSATYTLSNQWEGAIIVCDGADWFITGGVTNSGGGGGGGGGLGGGD